MRSSTSRTLELLALLQSGRPWSAAALADRLASSERTVRRDVARLRGLGYAIDSCPGPGGAYRLVPGTKIPPLLLEPDEASILTTALLMLEASSPDPTAVSSVRGKLEQVLPSHLRRRAAATAMATQVILGEADVVSWELIGILSEAVAGGQRVAFTYIDLAGHASSRRVEPYRHVLRDGHWYLVAFDLDRDDWRLFRLDRMADATGGPLSAIGHDFPFASIEGWLGSDFGRTEDASFNATAGTSGTGSSTGSRTSPGRSPSRTAGRASPPARGRSGNGRSSPTS